MNASWPPLPLAQCPRPTPYTQKGYKMHILAFTLWSVYVAVTAMWLGDNGWTPEVGIPFIIITWGYFIYVLRQDFVNRRR